MHCHQPSSGASAILGSTVLGGGGGGGAGGAGGGGELAGPGIETCHIFPGHCGIGGATPILACQIKKDGTQ